MRRGLLVYSLKPLELKFLELLVLETFDEDRFSAPIRMEEWSQVLGFRDSSGIRVDKARRVFDTLRELLIVDANEGQGTYQLRPDISAWSTLRVCGDIGTAQKELGLCAERPLDEALSSVSRDNALASGEVQVLDPDFAALYSKMKEMVAGKCSQEEVDQLWEKHRRINPPDARRNSPEVSADLSADAKPSVNPAFSPPEAKSAGPSLALASSACTDLKAKLAKASAKSAELEGKALAWLEGIDAHGHLKGTFGAQWRDLCERDPGYVLRRLRGKLENHNSRVGRESGLQPVADPLAWLARSAWDEGKMRRV
jgi:hypothetical protein